MSNGFISIIEAYYPDGIYIYYEMFGKQEVLPCVITDNNGHVVVSHEYTMIIRRDAILKRATPIFLIGD